MRPSGWRSEVDRLRVPCLALGTTIHLVLASGCLPALDPALLQEDASTGLCVGGTPNGELEPGEECDDANVVDDDGCTPGCELACEGLLDPATGTCYELGSPEIQPMAAPDRCSDMGGDAYPVSIRSDRERDLLIAWLEPTSVEAVLAGLVAEDNLRAWRSAAPAHPGWSADPPCPGCYAWWADGEPQPGGIRRVAVMRKSRGWRWDVGSSLETYALVCERPRAGRAVSTCALPDCDPANTREFSAMGNTYRVRETALSLITAEESCRAWNGHLVTITSEEEREMLARFGPSMRFWIGLFREQGKDWQWVDGVSTTVRPIPWSSAVIDDNHLGAVLSATTTFDTKLVASNNALAPLPYVCKRPSSDATTKDLPRPRANP